MKCPICSNKTKVYDSRQNGEQIKRYRECSNCLTRFTTYESINFVSLPKYVQKRMVKEGF